MRSSSANLPGVLLGSFDHAFVADLYYDGQRLIESVPINMESLADDDSSFIKSAGTCTITWQDDFGASVAPFALDDVFAPFGSELAIYSQVRAGDFVERIPMGWYQIVDIPEMRDETMLFRGVTISSGTTLHVQFQDRFILISRDKFDTPTAPSQLGSVYLELQALTSLQITQGVADAGITRTVLYKEEKSEAVLDLADLTFGIPYMTSDGTLSIRPKVWGSPVDTMQAGDEGSIVNIQHGMSSDGVYNKVVVRGNTSAQTPIVAYAEYTTGPLRTSNPDGSRSPAHRRPTFIDSTFVTTLAQAQALADSELPRKASTAAVQWPIEETFNPLRELGDVVNVINELGQTALCRIVNIARTSAATQTVTVTRG